MAYNGWTNHETWLVNLWVGGDMVELAQDGQELDGVYVQECVLDILCDMESRTVEGGFASDLIRSALKHVNWQEIADNAMGV
jgi:hypothetical protein